MAGVNFEIKSDNVAGKDIEFGFIEYRGIYSRFFLPRDNRDKLDLVLYTNVNGEDIAIGKIYTVMNDEYGENELKCKVISSDIYAEDLIDYIKTMLLIKNHLISKYNYL